MTNNLGELEAFRAAHDCEAEEWYVEEIDDKLVHSCKTCGREIEV